MTEGGWPIRIGWAGSRADRSPPPFTWEQKFRFGKWKSRLWGRALSLWSLCFNALPSCGAAKPGDSVCSS